MNNELKTEELVIDSKLGKSTVISNKDASLKVETFKMPKRIRNAFRRGVKAGRTSRKKTD